ncbi:hypothetical protein SISNIDRAFT_457658, partial [Sistotremastrum niveocremeum HHB9708]
GELTLFKSNHPAGTKDKRRRKEKKKKEENKKKTHKYTRSHRLPVHALPRRTTSITRSMKIDYMQSN